MRKLSFVISFATIILVSSTSTFAQEEITKKIEVAQQELVEIPVNELPETVITQITSNFTEHTGAQAFKTLKNEKEIYLIYYTKEDNNITVLFDATGKVIEQKDNIL